MKANFTNDLSTAITMILALSRIGGREPAGSLASLSGRDAGSDSSRGQGPSRVAITLILGKSHDFLDGGN